MGYSDLINKFEMNRDYLREFYVYGFRNAKEVNKKSQRSYNYDLQRIRNILSEYMSFRQSQEGRVQFISVDSRNVLRNPLYKAFKISSFTDNDIILHFFILDVLRNAEWMSNTEIFDSVYDYCTRGWFDAETCNKKMMVPKTLENKLTEYTKLGILEQKKKGKDNYYRLKKNDIDIQAWHDAYDFFSEINPLGVIGSYLLDREGSFEADEVFGYKHHYLLYAIDTEVIYSLLEAISKKCMVSFEKISKSKKVTKHEVYPFRIYLSVQGGRAYLLCKEVRSSGLAFIRLDSIKNVKKKGPVEKYAEFENDYYAAKPYLWGVVVGSPKDIVHLEITIQVEENEAHILERLEREKRNGSIHKLSKDKYKYVVDCYDAMELMPWVRTFIGRITKIESNNPEVEVKFNEDMDRLYEMYFGGDD